MSSVSRILGGKPAGPHSQPWVVIVDSCRDCGGTLISRRHVLTAGHCVDKDIIGYTIRKVILGDHNCNVDDGGEMSVLVKRIDIHPDYFVEADAGFWDFAILTLKKAVRFSSTIIPACLPTDPAEDYVGRNVTASGWGLTKIGSSGHEHRNNGTLMSVDLKVKPMTECEKAKWLTDKMDQIELPQEVKLINDSFMMCVGTHDEYNVIWMGIHKGDSGGEYSNNQ